MNTVPRTEKLTRPRGARADVAAAIWMLAFLPAASLAETTADPRRTIAIAEDRRRFEDLERFLSHPDSAIRARAALAVGRLQDSTTVSNLLPLLADPSRGVRAEAVFALGQIGHRAAREPLEAFLPAADESLAALAIESLGKLGDPAATPRVAGYLRHESPPLRGEAAVALWRLADSTALDLLLERHADPDPEVRWRVLYALEKIVSPDRVVLLAALHLEDPEWLVRAYAARTLGRQKSRHATAYVVQRFGDRVPAVAVNALKALQQLADSTCVYCAKSVLATLAHADPYVRVTAAQVLAEPFLLAVADAPVRGEVIDSLAAHLADPDAATRGACARSLLRMQGEKALDRVEPLLSDSSIYVRAAVIEGLGSLPAERVTPLLLARAGPGSPLFERMTAALALGSTRGPGAAEALRAGLVDTSLLVVAASAAALERLGDSTAVEALSRAYAARAGDADADARISIRDALRSLAGRAYADSIERAQPLRNAAPTFPPDFENAPRILGAVLETTAGEIEWEFFGEEAPQTVKNFVRLAERGYFDGTVFHRVVPNFVIQDGDPTGTGWGGPGYTIRCEYNRLRYEPGMVGMALSGKDTGGSQWFITHSPQPHLNGRYTIFARVTRGMDVVQRVVQGDRVTRVRLLR